MRIPTEADWRSEPWCLDAKYAYQNFHGKSLGEAVKLFEDNALRYQEDVLFMPSRVFGYYIKAYMTYLTSDAAQGDSDGASCFIALIAFKAEHQPADIAPLWPEIEPVLKRLADHQEWYEALWEVYGSFRSGIHKIVERGFETSFDTTLPEVVPQGISLQDCFRSGPLSLTVAAQLFRNSGIVGIDPTSKKSDVLRVFGPPDANGGGEGCPYGFAEWVRYDRLNRSIHFAFDGDEVAAVTIMHPHSLAGTSSLGEIDAEILATKRAFQAWNALFDPPAHDANANPTTPSVDEGSR